MPAFRVLGKNPFGWFSQSVRRFGLGQTVTIVWSVLVDACFDLRYGTDTFRRIPGNQIATDSENARHSANYGATKAMPFLRLVRGLRLPVDAVFVDLGSGKGRVLMLASKYGFRKIIGIEFSKALCEIARCNLEKFLRKSPSSSAIQVVESDVTRYAFADDETVFFMFDPFNAPVLEQVLRNLAESLKRRPRKIWLLYDSPREREVVERSGVFSHRQLRVVLGVEFMVFSNEALP